MKTRSERKAGRNGSGLRPAGGLAFAVAALSACAPTLPVPTAGTVAWAQSQGMRVDQEALHQGRTLYASRCDGCHAPPRFSAYAPEEWPKIMDEMSVEAKLSVREDSLVRGYVMAVSGWLRDSLAAGER